MTTLQLPTLEFVASPNFSSRNGVKVDLIVCHDCEGNAAGAVNWFSQRKSDVSAHLVIREDGAHAWQMVDFEDKAWHAVDFNSRSIGVEMGGFEAKGFAGGEWGMTANVVAYLLHKFGIPPVWSTNGEAAGFCSHRDLGRAGGGHVDPTKNLQIWQNFVAKVKNAYELAPPEIWVGVHGEPPAKPAGFVPTPTARKD